MKYSHSVNLEYKPELSVLYRETIAFKLGPVEKQQQLDNNNHKPIQGQWTQPHNLHHTHTHTRTHTRTHTPQLVNSFADKRVGVCVCVGGGEI